MRYHIVLLLACGSPVLGFVSQMRHGGGPRPANRASPACLLVFLCLLLLVFRFARRSAWAVRYFESVCLFLCLFYGYCHAFRPPIAPGARELHISVWNPVLYLKYRGFPGARSTGRFYLFKKYAGPGHRVSRAVCPDELSPLATMSRVLEPKHGSRSREPYTLIVSSHVTAPLTRDISATKLSHMQPKNI